MNEIYLVMYDSMYGCESSFEVYPYTNIESAKRKLKEIVDEFKANDELANSEDCVIETDGFTEFTAYEEGRYCENHLSVYITKKKIEE